MEHVQQAKAMRSNLITMAFGFALLGTLLHASSVEHPGILHQDDNCLPCHAAKARGASVHAAMESPCTVCHLARTQGDMTTLELLMPREEICFACHTRSSGARHARAVKGGCLECHDAHSSDRRMLLLDVKGMPRKISPMLAGKSKKVRLP